MLFPFLVNRDQNIWGSFCYVGSTTFIVDLTCDVAVNCIFSVLVNMLPQHRHLKTLFPLYKPYFGSEFSYTVIHSDGFDGSPDLVLWF